MSGQRLRSGTAPLRSDAPVAPAPRNHLRRVLTGAFVALLVAVLVVGVIALFAVFGPNR